MDMAIVVKRVKGKKYVYEQYRAAGRVVTRYIGPLEEMARVYELYRRGDLSRLSKRLLRYYAKQIAREVSGKLEKALVNSHVKSDRTGMEMVRPPGFEPGTPGLGEQNTSLINVPRGPSLSNAFREWLGGRGLRVDTIDYYVSVVDKWDGTVPESRARRKAVRQYLLFLYERGLLSRERYLELRDRVRIGGYKPSGGTQRAIALSEVLEPLERLQGSLRLLWLMGLYSGARLSHVLETLSGWSPGEEVVVFVSVRRKRLECVDSVCTYWLGSVHGRKKQYEVFLPAWLTARVSALDIPYSVMNILYHRYGARYSLLRKYANQRLAELALRHGYPEDAWRWILSRDISVAGRHYLNLHDIALGLYRIYAMGLDPVIPESGIEVS